MIALRKLNTPHFVLIMLLFSLLLVGCNNSKPAATTTTATPPSVAETPAADQPPTVTPIPPPSPTPTKPPQNLAATPVAIQQETPAPAVISATPATSRTQVEIITSAVNVRAGPGTKFPIIGGALASDTFDIEGSDETGAWLKIVFDRDEGWITAQAEYVRLLDNAINVPVAPLPSGVGAGVPQSPLPTGGRLIVASRSGGDLYLIELENDNTVVQELAKNVIDPAISPDGNQVAFTRWDGSEFGALYILDLATSQERVVAGEIRQPKSPTWSPDGGKIVISFQHGGMRNPQQECRKFDFNDGVNLPDNVTIVYTDVDADGRLVVCFIENEDLHWLLREIDVESGQFADLPSAQYAYSPTWDPQNPWRVVYSGPAGLMQFDVNEQREWPLTTDLRDKEPVFSPDGQQLAVTYRQHDHWEVYTVDVQTGQRQRLTKPPILADPQYSSAAPTWSPDGTQLAFVTDRRGSWELWVMDADGSNPRPLLSPELQTRLSLEYAGVNERLLNWLK
jgi:dipeptidyl aminopeptidase/acylaminoacyl peptidase